MIFNSLGVAPKEQTLALSEENSVEIRFDPFYYRWYGNFYAGGELVAAGVALDPNTAGLLDILAVSIAIYDSGDPKVKYEPYEELGDRLAVIEVVDK
jgi:hypothetical protein